MVKEFLQIDFDAENKIWTSSHYPYKDQVYGSLGERFLKNMRSIDPNKIIDHFYDTNRRKTAKEVYQESITVAKNLQRLGIKKNDVVVFYCMNNEDVAVLTIGCILIGALVNYCEVHMLGEHDDQVLGILQPTVILYEEKFKTKVYESLKRLDLNCLKYTISIDGKQQPNVKNDLLKYDEIIDYDDFVSVEIEDPQNELAYLLLTSGSTGVPKIVQITHTLIMHGTFIWYDNKTHHEPISQDCILYSLSPLRWISQAITVVGLMVVGAGRASSCGAPNGKHDLNVLLTTRPTHVFGAPTLLYNILLELNQDDKESLQFVKTLLLGGEPAADIIKRTAKNHLINARIYHCYGMTEMTSCITNDEDMNGGKLLPGYQMQILDNQCKPLGPNENGQIALKPPYPLKGYKSIDNAKYYNEKGFFINGDYGNIDEEGNLHVLARYKDLIYSNNVTLIPNRLEHIIINLPEISVARLAGYRRTPEDPNESGTFFVVLHPDVTCTHDDITKKILNTLKCHMTSEELAIIKDIYFVDSVPLTTCGKVDRVALKQWAMKRAHCK